MPGATDEFYMFRRAKAALTAASPTLLDALTALTNQTLIRATFHPPLLLLHTDEDPLDPSITIEHEPTAAKLRLASFVPHALYNDRDWDFIQPILAKKLKADVRPWRHMYDTWHFYRHSFAGWNLTGWEALEAVALAGKTRFTVGKKSGLALRPTLLIFEGDERVRAIPKIESFPVENHCLLLRHAAKNRTIVSTKTLEILNYLQPKCFKDQLDGRASSFGTISARSTACERRDIL